MDPFDEEPSASPTSEQALPRRGPRERRPRRPRRQQVMARRGIALGGALIVVILLVSGSAAASTPVTIGPSRTTHATSPRSSTRPRQTSKRFFARLEDPGSASVTDFVTETNADRSAMDGYLTRVEDLSAPGDMSGAQDGLELVYELRAAAFGKIADKMSTALGDAGRERAMASIANQMRTLLASDVLYAQVVAPQINGVLADQGIEGSERPRQRVHPRMATPSGLIRARSTAPSAR